MEHNILIQGEPLSREKFFSPSREFGIMPFWFWNGKLTYDEMEYQLRELHAKGIPGIYIHSRFGAQEHVPYISEDWFDRVRFTVEKAQEIGLQIWIYDEYNWPSGTAGQSIMRERPELTSRYLEMVEDRIPGQYFVFMEGTDSRYNDLEQSEPVYACAILEKDLEAGNPNFIDLMPLLCFDKVISWETPPGPWRMFYFIERKATWYSDVLNPETTKEFLERTHERYKQSVGGEFGGRIKGFYTDEPAMYYFDLFHNNNCLPWTAQMFKVFKEKRGYNLKPFLPMLYYDIGPKTEQVRYDFFSALSSQYEQSYYAAIEDWCAENGVVSTGHLLCEESVRTHARTGGNLFHMLRHFHMTGVDHLYPRVGTRAMPNEHVALKIASSAAHQNGSARLLCESMGGLHWDVTMERMKWVADWEYVLGVNLLNPHGFHYSIEGPRKRDWPPSQFYHHTWWKEYADFNSYITRLGYVLSGGRHVAKLAVIYPINTVWATYTPQAPNKVNDLVEREFAYLADRLLRLHVDYDYLDEDILAEASVENGRITVRDEEYEAVLLPCLTHIKAETLGALEKFVAGGGKVLADALLPVMCIEGECESFNERIVKLFGGNSKEIRRDFECGKSKGVELRIGKANENGGVTVLARGEGFEAGDSFDELKKAVLSVVTPEIEINSDEIFYLHRVKDGEDFWFLINPTGETIDAEITWTGKLTPESWNLENGDITPYMEYSVKDGVTGIKLRFEPFGSHLIRTSAYANGPHVTDVNFAVLSVSDKQVCGYGGEDAEKYAVLDCGGVSRRLSVEVPQKAVSVELPAEWDFHAEKPNTLLVGKWKVKYASGEEPLQFAKEVSADGFDFSGWMDFKMGAWEMQLEEERDDTSYPVTLWYVTDFCAEYIPGSLSMLVDGFTGASFELFLNGIAVNGPYKRSWLDSDIGEAEIAKLVKSGRNTVAVKLTVTKKADGMLDLLKICGDIGVREIGGSMTITAPERRLPLGDWCGYGLPYYSGAGVYSAEFTLPAGCESMRVFVEADVGSDIFGAEVNGIDAGTRLWKPYRLDITDSVKTGVNALKLRVVNTLVNLLEGKTQASGLFGLKITAESEFTLTMENEI